MKIGFASADWSGSVFDANGHPVWGGSGWARLGQYQKLLPHDVKVGVLCSRGQEFGVRDWDNNYHFGFDIIIMQRVMMKSVADFMPKAIANGQIIINDIDDWYWGLSPANGAWLATHPKHSPDENINHYKSIISRSTAVTVSTDYLASRIKDWIRCPIQIVNNYVDIDRFIPHQHTDTHIPTVGWVGSTSHRSGDLEVLRPILPRLLKEGKIKLHHSGNVVGARSFAEAIGVAEHEVSTLPMAGPDLYPTLLNFDIGLVPLTDVPFNHAKSYIKGLEYAAAGIPFVASDINEYSTLSQRNGIGRTVKKANQWIAAIEQLCDPEVRSNEARLNLERLAPLSVYVGATLLNEYLESLV
jgi:glycosyltransferase involved in cell wall biosynthesis